MGGNNLLQPLMKMMKEGLGLDVNATGIELQEAMKNNPNALAILGTSLQNPQIVQSLSWKVELFTKEFPEIINIIKRLNPNAEIIIQTIYNPLHDVKELLTLADAVDPFFQVMNKAISEGSILGYKVVDVYEEFKSNDSHRLCNAGIILCLSLPVRMNLAVSEYSSIRLRNALCA
jgi:hypothetical protein